MNSPEEVRLKLTLHYDGTDFFGWQIQASERTVQGELQAAVRRITGLDVTVTGAGRTDRGVHATGQVAAVVVPAKWTPADFQKAMNAVLPHDVWIRETTQVPASFHPRMHAESRTYRYKVGVTRACQSPFHRPWCWCLNRELDTAILQQCADLLPGTHSFKSFRKAGQEARGDRSVVYSAQWDPWEELGYVFEISAKRYLHHMVRYLVGTMVAVARGSRDFSEMESMLENPDSLLITSPPAPPQGLCLAEVCYPDTLPEQSSAPEEANLEPQSELQE